MASERIDLFAEVQGIFEYSSGNFKAGETYKKGQILIKINSDEFRASLVSQRSQYKNIITSILPDIKYDYPDSYQKWENYLYSINMTRNLPNLPKITDKQESLFVTQKSVISTFYTIKNSEERLGKYEIVAPFDGILTEAFVNKGTLVRAGQALGEFINPMKFELEIALEVSNVPLIGPGKEVILKNLTGMGEWKGTISRINGKIDQGSQTVKVFIQTEGELLKEGMYLTAEISGREESDVIQIQRNLLNNEKYIYLVKDSILEMKEIIPIHMTDKIAIVRGLKNGEIILKKPVAGAYEGMLVTPYTGE